MATCSVAALGCEVGGVWQSTLPLLTGLNAMRQWLFVKKGKSLLRMSQVCRDVAMLRLWCWKSASARD
eukprot:4603839-Prorocentrum_lima.AAC.1